MTSAATGSVSTSFRRKTGRRVLTPLFFLLIGYLPAAQEETPSGDPEILSIFPQGGNPGTAIQAEVRGTNLDGAYAVWFDDDALQARVQKVEEIRLEPEKTYVREPPEGQLGNRVLLQIKVNDTAGVGSHLLRLVSPSGVSNALTFWIHADPVIRESREPHHGPDQAQPVSAPTVIQGRISQEGELDYYELQVAARQPLTFEVIAPGLDPRIVLYEPAGSWFDPDRAREVAFAAYDEAFDEQSTRLTHRFHQAGRYLVQVGSNFSQGNPDFIYQLRVRPGDRADAENRIAAPVTASDWKERDFTREIVPDRLQILWSRTVQTPEDDSESGENTTSDLAEGKTLAGKPKGRLSATATAVVIREEEPNETASQALELSLPAVIEGVIERPGDMDHFKFRVQSGERLAFEIETPNSVPPQFHPRLGILDGDGNEFCTNIYKRMERQFQFYMKTAEAKTVYMFKLGGEYTLQIRDVTSNYGAPSFVYRVLIRPQIPHVGEIEVKEDRINLVPGEARKLTVMTGQEEGFAWEIALTMENLPPGVVALPGTEVEPEGGVNPDEGPKERFLAKTQKATIVLVARVDAPATAMPRVVTMMARPIVEGKPGAPLPVAEIPLMVVGAVGVQDGAP